MNKKKQKIFLFETVDFNEESTRNISKSAQIRND